MKTSRIEILLGHDFLENLKKEIEEISFINNEIEREKEFFTKLLDLLVDKLQYYELLLPLKKKCFLSILSLMGEGAYRTLRDLINLFNHLNQQKEELEERLKEEMEENNISTKTGVSNADISTFLKLINDEKILSLSKKLTNDLNVEEAMREGPYVLFCK